MEVINQSFKQAALELDESSDLIGATFKDYGVLELRDWEHICKHGWIEKSWLFSILFFAEGSPFYKTIGYLKRHIPLAIDTFSAPKVPPVALYFTGTTAPTGTRPNFADYSMIINSSIGSLTPTRIGKFKRRPVSHQLSRSSSWTSSSEKRVLAPEPRPH
jgi:hypothetical protein